MATPLHNHSEYSKIDGLSKIDEIADRMEETGRTACGLTDHGVVAGHLEFDKVFRKRGLKPLFGCELYHGVAFGEVKGAQRDQAHLIALAMTDVGLQNLWRLNDAAAQEEQFHHVGRVSWDNLREFREGLVITSACAGGLVPKGLLRGDYTALNQYLEIFGDNFYIELSTYPDWAVFEDSDLEEGISPGALNELLLDTAIERGIPITYGDDGHYAFPHQFEAHDAYIAKSTGQSIYTPLEERKMYHPEGALCIKTEEEVREALSYLPEAAVDEALRNTDEIAERADAHLPEVRRHLPKFVPKDSPWVTEKYDDDAADLLFLDLIEKGMYERYGDEPDEQVIEQTQYEAEIFIEAGLHHYFLLAWDVMQFCDNPSTIFPEVDPRPIERGPGRGSSAGCINAFELGITDVNPLPYDLIFERFWNPGRAKGFPDIDSDFEKFRRREVKDYLALRWGHNRVRSIGNITRMKPLGLVEIMWHAGGISYTEAEALKKIIAKTPDLEILGVDQIGWAREADPGKVWYVWEEVGEDILDWIKKQPKNRHDVLLRFIELCEVLCNRVSNYGVHASGIVISDEDLQAIAPCRFASAKEQRIPVTQFAMDDIDALMLVKFDALGLRTLDVLADWKHQMQEDHGIEVEWSQLEWEEHPEEIWELLDDGYSSGIFQIEKGYPKQLCEKIKPRGVLDMSAIVALNRPGPIRSGAPDSYIARRAGTEEVTYDAPFLEDILKDTYGWFLYQESVIRYFNKLGYSESDADVVRKILGKKQPEKWVDLFQGRDEWKGKGYIEMAAKAGLGDIETTKARFWEGQDVDGLWDEVKEPAWVIWRKIVDFAKYSFNKAHSVAYGTIAFRCAFAKYYGSAEFYKACIRKVDKNKKTERIPMYINEARRMGIPVLPPDILRSLSVVSTNQGDILFGFSDVKNVGEAGELICDIRNDYEVTTPELLDDALVAEGEQWSARKKEAKLKEAKFVERSPKQQLGSNKIASLYNAGAWDAYLDRGITMQQKQAYEKELLGVIISDDSPQILMNNYDKIADCDTYDEALAPWDGEERIHTLCGTITSLRETFTKKEGKAMGIVTIEYEGDELEFAVFPAQWKAYKFLWKERTPGIFTIRYNLNKQDEPGYNFKEGEKLS